MLEQCETCVERLQDSPPLRLLHAMDEQFEAHTQQLFHAYSGLRLSLSLAMLEQCESTIQRLHQVIS